MKILALECSVSPASVAIIDNGKIISQCFINVKLTHSQTLMPMVKSALDLSLTKFDDIEGIAISSGPGSFTGIRIGISAVKGLCIAKKLPCVGVSTLRGIAENFKGQNAIICAVMDARCNQVYNALFKVDGDTVERLCEDRALMCTELAEQLREYNEKIIVCGDGTDLFYSFVCDNENVFLAPERLKYQSATGVGLCAYSEFLSGNTVSSEELLPVYLRLPQAERELKAKKEKQE